MTYRARAGGLRRGLTSAPSQAPPDGCFVLGRYMSLAVCELDRPGHGPLVAAACSDGAVR